MSRTLCVYVSMAESETVAELLAKAMADVRIVRACVRIVVCVGDSSMRKR